MHTTVGIPLFVAVLAQVAQCESEPSDNTAKFGRLKGTPRSEIPSGEIILLPGVFAPIEAGTGIDGG